MSDEQPQADQSHSLLVKSHSFPASPSLESTPESSREPSLSIPSSELHTARSLPSLAPRNSSGVNVKFAPLPVTEKSRSRHPSFHYGVGARSRLLRNKRLMQELEAAAERGDTIYVTEGEPLPTIVREEDPVVVLGRKMVGASKSWWRRVARKQELVHQEADAQPIGDSSPPSDGKTVVIVRRKSEEKSAAADEKEEEGRVWEEEIDPDFCRRMSLVDVGEPERADGGSTDDIPNSKKTQVQALGKKTPKRKELRRAATS